MDVMVVGSRLNLVGSVLAYWNIRPEFKPYVRHQTENMKIFPWQLGLSRFLAKSLEVNKPAMKKFLKSLLYFKL